MVIVALLPFVVSLVISGSVFTDLLEVLWYGLAGGFLGLRGAGSWLWGITLILLLVGMLAFAAGLALVVVAFGAWQDYGYLAPTGVAALDVCGLSVLTAVVVPPVALGPPRGRWLATAAAALGGFAVTMEAVVAFHPPFGSDPFLGWMEGTFPLLNWNFGFGTMVAVSAFLIWESYRFLLPAERTTPVLA